MSKIQNPYTFRGGDLENELDCGGSILISELIDEFIAECDIGGGPWGRDGSLGA